MTSNDQQNLISHLSVLYESASQFASETAFLIPHERNGEQTQDFSWDTVTYEQFLNDVERYALLWRRVLLSRDISAGSVVGLWNVYNFLIAGLRLFANYQQDSWLHILGPSSYLRYLEGRIHSAAL